MSGIQLVSAKAGITNYYHNQVVRNPAMDINSQLIDQLTFENHNGGVKGSTLLHTAVMSGGLNAQATDYASIQGGWNESKGLMLLKFVTQNSPVLVEYMNVLGYISNNQAMGAISEDAIFHPVMSWKTQETITSNFGDIHNPTSIQRQIGGRTDYMFNDGSNDMASLVTLRPSDVIEYGLESASRESIMDRMDDEGLDGFHPVVNPANASINRAGVIASKRANTNPTNYATDILRAGVDFQSNKLMAGNALDTGEMGTQFDGMFGELNVLSYQAQQAEPQLLRDPFFLEMMNQLGIHQSRGFNGYSIKDLIFAFDNLDDVLDLTFMNAEEFMVDDFTQNTEVFGTSNYAEVLASELEANMLDLMLKYGLNGISFKGSNCDNFGDGGLDNIVILPYAPSPIQEDDFQLGQRCEAFVQALRTQIFTRLNGLSMNQMTPVRFNVSGELFGTTTIDIQIVNDNNNSMAFDVNDTDAPVGIVRAFPTFAINSTSPILGTSESAQVAGSNFFSNIESYFQ